MNEAREQLVEEGEGLIQASLRKIQGLFKDYPTFFKDEKCMNNPELSVKILHQKC